MLRSPINYLNTDLDVTATQDPAMLVEQLQRAGLFALHVEPSNDGATWAITFECDGTAEDAGEASPAQTITELLDAVEGVTGDARRVWDSATLRVFNIGVESVEQRGPHYIDVPQTLLTRIAALGADLRVTFYGPSSNT
ncbi:MAG: hypothetical protein MRY74_04635 [Neomegalonema sp.]|nr:hypothetical protein [Neomegalonema sp.]